MFENPTSSFWLKPKLGFEWMTLASAAGAIHLARLRVADASASWCAFSSFGVLIQHCADHGLFRHGLQLHARLILLSIVPDNFLGSKLISLYSRSGHLHNARLIFDSITIKNLFSWNAMLLAYSLHEQTVSYLRLFSSIPPSLRPDAFTLSSLLKSISTVAKEVHSFGLRLGYDADIYVSNGLITAYLRNSDQKYARKIFDRMLTRDIVSWNSIISGLSEKGHYSACIQLYQELEMEKNGVKPNGVTVTSVLHACSQLRDLVSGMGIHMFAVQSGMAIDVVVCNSIIGLYSRCGSLDYARSLFDCMDERDGVTYNTMISGYMAYGYVDRAMELFHQIPCPVLSTWNAVIGGLVQNNSFHHVLDLFRAMQKAGFRPNPVTLSCLLPAISFHSNLRIIKEIHLYAIRNCCHQNIYVATALINAYSKAGFIEGADRVFDGIEARNRSVVIWTAIISAYAMLGDAGTALAVFASMIESRVEPDSVTFTAILSACAHGGEVDEAHRILNSVMPEYGISPEVEQYACVAGALSRKGLLAEAVVFINRMPIQPTAKVWGALLNGAAVYREVDVGEYAFEKLFEIEPGNTGNYIVMANLYSQAGKWKEAQMVRNKMREVGLAKVPGCSWIEAHGRMQVFVTNDVTNEQSKEVFDLIDQLLGLMREEGYFTREEMDEESCC